jgi:hypothetical protein
MYHSARLSAGVVAARGCGRMRHLGSSGGRPATWLRACPIRRSSALSSRLGLWSRHRVVIGDLNQAASHSSRQNAATSGQRLTCEASRARPSPRRIRGAGGEGSDESGDIRAAALVRAAQNCQSARLPQQDRATRGRANTRYGGEPTRPRGTALLVGRWSPRFVFIRFAWAYRAVSAQL